MKKKFFLLALAALPLTSFVSCDDDDDGPEQQTGIKVVSNTCSESFGTIVGRKSVYMSSSYDTTTGVVTVVIDSIYALQKPTLVLDSVFYDQIDSPVDGNYDLCSLTLKNSGLDLVLENGLFYRDSVLAKAYTDSLAALDAKTYGLYKITLTLSGIDKKKGCRVVADAGSSRATTYVLPEGPNSRDFFNFLWKMKN